MSITTNRLIGWPEVFLPQPALRASLFLNPHRRDSQNPPYPCDNGGKGQLGFHILASTRWTLRLYSWILNNHGSISLLMDDVSLPI
jgi:hypothetical protein